MHSGIALLVLKVLWTEADVLLCVVSGEVSFTAADVKMTLAEAREECARQGAVLASPGHLHAAWRAGLDRCDFAWLSDGSARYPISVPRQQCGKGQLGVRTMYRFPNQTGFPLPSEKLGAFCFKGVSSRNTHDKNKSFKLTEWMSGKLHSPKKKWFTSITIANLTKNCFLMWRFLNKYLYKEN